MILLDSLFISGMRFVFQQLANLADSELDDSTRLREELLDAQMRLELGELSEEDFVAIEGDLLARLRVLRERELEPVSLVDAEAGSVAVEVNADLGDAR